MRLRLSIVTFLLFFSLGATAPILSLYLTDRLGFTGAQTGLVLSMSAFSTLASPLICGLLADRVLPAERLFALLLLAGAACMGALYRTASFSAFLLLYLLYQLAVGATVGLANAVTFHKLPDRRGYGGIRVWGTVGWIAVAWLFGWFWLRGGGGGARADRLPDALLLGAASMAALGLYALTLPPTVERGRGAPELLPRAAFAAFRRPAALWLVALAAAAAVTDRMYGYGAAIFLKERGVAEADILPLLSLGQVPEVLAMVLLGRLAARFGLVRVMLAGAAANAARYGLFLFGSGRLALAAGISLHGVAYAFFFSSAYVLIDGMADAESRAGVHQLFGLLTTGVGGLLGNWLAGAALDAFRGPGGAVRFGPLWAIPFGLALATAVGLLWAPASLGGAGRGASRG